MASFKDAAGRDWQVSLRLSMLPRLRESGVDLNRIAGEDGGLVGLIALDPETLGTVLWIVCEREAEKRHVTPGDFADGFDPTTVLAAQNALLEAAVDFFRPRDAAKIRAAIPHILGRLDREVGEAIAAAIDGLNKPRGDGAARSDSTPAN